MQQTLFFRANSLREAVSMITGKGSEELASEIRRVYLAQRAVREAGNLKKFEQESYFLVFGRSPQRDWDRAGVVRRIEQLREGSHRGGREFEPIFSAEGQQYMAGKCSKGRAKSKVVLNIHADSSPVYASNMRLFETTRRRNMPGY